MSSEVVVYGQTPARDWAFMRTIGGYNYLGPGTPLTREYLETHPPVDALDAIAQEHDLAYHEIAFRLGKGYYTPEQAREAVAQVDHRMIRELTHIHVSNQAAATYAIMQGKNILDTMNLSDPLKYLYPLPTESLQNPKKRSLDSPQLAKVTRKRRSEVAPFIPLNVKPYRFSHSQIFTPAPSMSYRKRFRSTSVSAPMARSSSVATGRATSKIYLTGREFVFAPTSAATNPVFKTTSHLLSPTDAHVFPWLSPIARQFSEYKFSYVRYVFEPAISTAYSGTVGMYFDSDPEAPEPSSWKSITQHGNSVHGACWGKHALVLPRSVINGRAKYYCRDQYPNRESKDFLEHYPGKYFFCSEGILKPDGQTASEVSLGRIYIEYGISLWNPEPAWDNVMSITDESISLAGPVAFPAMSVYHVLTVATAGNWFANAGTFGGMPLFEPVKGSLGDAWVADSTRTVKFSTDFEGLILFTGTTATNIDYACSIAAGDNENGLVGTITKRFDAPSGGTAVSRMSLWAVTAKQGNTFVAALTITGAITGPAGLKMYCVPFPFGADL